MVSHPNLDTQLAFATICLMGVQRHLGHHSATRLLRATDTHIVEEKHLIRYHVICNWDFELRRADLAADALLQPQCEAREERMRRVNN